MSLTVTVALPVDVAIGSRRPGRTGAQYAATWWTCTSGTVGVGSAHYLERWSYHPCPAYRRSDCRRSRPGAAVTPPVPVPSSSARATGRISPRHRSRCRPSSWSTCRTASAATRATARATARVAAPAAAGRAAGATARAAGAAALVPPEPLLVVPPEPLSWCRQSRRCVPARTLGGLVVSARAARGQEAERPTLVIDVRVLFMTPTFFRSVHTEPTRCATGPWTVVCQLEPHTKGFFQGTFVSSTAALRSSSHF